VFLDNLSHLFTGNENDRGDVTRFLNLLNRLAGETGVAIVLLGHTPKAFNQGNTRGNGHSGSTAAQCGAVAVCA
jgi:RecA-family ATPase